jgi:hypothetical protein
MTPLQTSPRPLPNPPLQGEGRGAAFITGEALKPYFSFKLGALFPPLHVGEGCFLLCKKRGEVRRIHLELKGILISTYFL